MNADLTHKTDLRPEPFPGGFAPVRAVMAAAQEQGYPRLRGRLVDFSNALRASETVPAAAVVAAAQKYLDPIAARAARAAAKLIDANPAFREPLYHNVPHYLEAAVTALAFAVAEAAAPTKFVSGRNISVPFSNLAVSDCLVGGLIHDIGHPGGANGGKSFRFETQSWALSEDILRRAGYEAPRLRRVQMMTLATEPAAGIPTVELAMRYHGSLGDVREEYRLEIARLTGRIKDHAQADLANALMKNVRLTAMCYLLNKAEIAFSAMPETYPARTRDLGDEFTAAGLDIPMVGADGVPLKGSADHFFDNILFGRNKDARLLRNSELVFLLDSVENTIGESARVTRSLAQNGQIAVRPRPFVAPRQLSR